jgi:hypothetical protein
MASAQTNELTPQNFSAASLTLGFDKAIHLNEKNKFRSSIIIDSNNRCTLVSSTAANKEKFTIAKGTEWKSEAVMDWTDWDTKSYNFKLTNKNQIVLLHCELNLTGEVLLFNSDTGKKNSSNCSKQGGKIQKNPPASYTLKIDHSADRAPASAPSEPSYCIKRIPKLKYSLIKSAFEKAKIKIQIDHPAEASL